MIIIIIIVIIEVSNISDGIGSAYLLHNRCRLEFCHHPRYVALFFPFRCDKEGVAVVHPTILVSYLHIVG